MAPREMPRRPALLPARGYTLYLEHFALQRDRGNRDTGRIVSEIRTALDVHLDPERRQQMLALGTADALAFHHYQRAAALRSTATPPGQKQALAVPDSDALAQLREMRTMAITDTAPQSDGRGPGHPGSDG